MLDLESTHSPDDARADLKRKIFWSFKILGQFYDRRTSFVLYPTQAWQSSCMPKYDNNERSHVSDASNVRLASASSPANNLEVWNHTIGLGGIWNSVRRYVSNAALLRIKEPWRRDSDYVQVLSDLVELETRFPLCHRYDTVKFYIRRREELINNQDYWKPWLKIQMLYHASQTLLNHPFIYLTLSQHNTNFAISNTFWRKSAETALLHATWTARMIDMVSEKQVELTDPFFAHAAAIGATVHLYYSAAADSKLSSKSHNDLAKCRSFIKDFTRHSSLCIELVREQCD